MLSCLGQSKFDFGANFHKYLQRDCLSRSLSVPLFLRVVCARTKSAMTDLDAHSASCETITNFYWTTINHVYVCMYMLCIHASADKINGMNLKHEKVS